MRTIIILFALFSFFTSCKQELNDKEMINSVQLVSTENDFLCTFLFEDIYRQVEEAYRIQNNQLLIDKPPYFFLPDSVKFFKTRNDSLNSDTIQLVYGDKCFDKKGIIRTGVITIITKENKSKRIIQFKDYKFDNNTISAEIEIHKIHQTLDSIYIRNAFVVLNSNKTIYYFSSQARFLVSGDNTESFSDDRLEVHAISGGINTLDSTYYTVTNIPYQFDYSCNYFAKGKSFFVFSTFPSVWLDYEFNSCDNTALVLSESGTEMPINIEY